MSLHARKHIALFAILVSFVVCLPLSGAAQKEDNSAPEPAVYGEIEIKEFIPEKLPRRYLLEPDIETFYELHSRLEKALADGNLDGLIVRIRPFDAGWAKVQALRDQLIQLRREGKRVICFVEGSSDQAYYLATAGDRIVLMPGSSLMLTGLRAEVMFWKGLLDKIGVKGQMLQVGKFKGSAEPYRRKEASQPLKETLSSLVNDMYSQMVSGIAQLRQFKESKVRSLVDKGPYTAAGAREAGLIDDVMHFGDLRNSLEEETKGRFHLVEEYKKKEPEPPSVSGPQALFQMFTGEKEESDLDVKADNAIALIYAVGPIIRKEPGDLSIGEYVTSAAVLRKVINRVQDRDDVKAVVVRINSPGGSSLASELIWDELRELNESKPVIASMADTAASGGYYIASAARTIVAQPATITGSIGVVGGKFVLQGLYEKIGLNVESFQQGARAGIFSSARPFSEDERSQMMELLKETYETFLKRVAEGRGKDVSEIRNAAQGRTWTGAQAKEQGLVDKLGGMNEAIRTAKKAAGIPVEKKVQVIRLPKPRSIIDLLMGANAKSSRGMPSAHWPLTRLPLDLERAKKCLAMLQCFRSQPTAYLMPALIRVE